ncbi:hypothetical protein [Haloferula sargassicola]|uniref:Lipoprotein n=1 Tax=Haloferula sargassicola TaxID=490096 RepID=A0ABP9ULU5_9BACT
MKMTAWLKGFGKWIALGGALAFAACSSYVPEGGMAEMAPSAGARDAAKPESRTRAAEERPGLATGFGEKVRDPWQKESFVRSSNGPAGTGMIYYNDEDGVEAMNGYRYKTESLTQVAGGMVEWGIKGRFGYWPAYRSGGKLFVEGKAGSNYSIVVKNRCRSRVEVVLSVDGLDVIDGKAASVRKRGYVIAAGETLEVKGWRTSWETVAKFEFSSVADSYANRRHGYTRNVGVIGIAVFGEKGVDPWKWMPREVNTRQTANPFAEDP